MRVEAPVVDLGHDRPLRDLRGFRRRADPAAAASGDPPEHRHYRKLVDHFFDAAGSARYADEIQRVVDDLIDSFVDDGRADFMQQFALPLPVRMITSILGFSDADIDQLKAWSSAWVLPFAGGLTEEQHVWVAEQVVEFQAFIQERLDDKRADPGDDVLSALAVVRFDDDRALTNPEIISIIDHLYIGGNQVSTNECGTTARS